MKVHYSRTQSFSLSFVAVTKPTLQSRLTEPSSCLHLKFSVHDLHPGGQPNTIHNKVFNVRSTEENICSIVVHSCLNV